RLGAAGGGGGAVDGGPGGAIARGLELVRGGVRGLPLQHHLTNGLGRAEVDAEPLWIAGGAGPAGAGVAVDRRAGGRAGVLDGGGGGRASLGGVGGATGGWRPADRPVHLELPQ